MTRALFVAAEGNDRNPGTESAPLASLEEARERLRASRTTRRRAHSSEVRICGNLRLGKTFELGPEDSGTFKYPVIYRAASNAGAVLTGGVLLKDFRPISDPAVRERLDAVARGHVVEADLRAHGISDFGAFSSRGFSRKFQALHLELFFNGEAMTPARWPNAGEEALIAGFPEETALKDGHGGAIGDLEHGFFYDGDRPRRWKSLRDIWVHGFWAWDWANSYERVASIDLERRWIRTADPFGLYGFRKGQRFHFINVLEELDRPGEWFLDRDSCLLYFWPPSELSGAKVHASVLSTPLIRVAGASHIHFEGLTLEHTRGTAVVIEGGKGVGVDGCRIRQTGSTGVTIRGGTDHRITRSEISANGDAGVWSEGGDRQTLTPSRHEVSHCHFFNQGRWSRCYVPSVYMNGVGSHVHHNLIHDHPHCAILFVGNDHLVEFNEIHHVCMETGDVGAIYTGRDWTFRGNRVQYNYIHETGGMGMGSMGVYLDDCVSTVDVIGNVFWRVQRAVFIGGGRDHRVENNVFVECNPAVEMDGRGLDPSPVWHDMVTVTMKERLSAIPRRLYNRRYPALRALDRLYARGKGGIPPGGVVIRHNVCRGSWVHLHWHADASMVSMGDNLVIETATGDPVPLAELAARPSLEAQALGFVAIPFDAIGPRGLTGT